MLHDTFLIFYILSSKIKELMINYTAQVLLFL